MLSPKLVEMLTPENSTAADMDPQSRTKHFSRRTWTAEEDAQLRDVVAKYGARQWSLIASHMGSRKDWQCRERWYNHLVPDVKKTDWTPEEDAIIIQALHVMGQKWCQIKNLLPGRTGHAVKNRYHTLRRRLQSHHPMAVAAAAGSGGVPTCMPHMGAVESAGPGPMRLYGSQLQPDPQLQQLRQQAAAAQLVGGPLASGLHLAAKRAGGESHHHSYASPHLRAGGGAGPIATATLGMPPSSMAAASMAMSSAMGGAQQAPYMALSQIGGLPTSTLPSLLGAQHSPHQPAAAALSAPALRRDRICELAQQLMILADTEMQTPAMSRLGEHGRERLVESVLGDLRRVITEKAGAEAAAAASVEMRDEGESDDADVGAPASGPPAEPRAVLASLPRNRSSEAMQLQLSHSDSRQKLQQHLAGAPDACRVPRAPSLEMLNALGLTWDDFNVSLTPPSRVASLEALTTIASGAC